MKRFKCKAAKSFYKLLSASNRSSLDKYLRFYNFAFLDSKYLSNRAFVDVRARASGLKKQKDKALQIANKSFVRQLVKQRHLKHISLLLKHDCKKYPSEQHLANLSNAIDAFLELCSKRGKNDFK